MDDKENRISTYYFHVSRTRMNCDEIEESIRLVAGLKNIKAIRDMLSDLHDKAVARVDAMEYVRDLAEDARDQAISLRRDRADDAAGINAGNARLR